MKSRLSNTIFSLCLALSSVTCALASAATSAATQTSTELNNKELVLRLITKAYNAHDLENLEQFFAPAFVHRDARGDQGIVAVKESFGPIFGAFSDWTGSVEQVLVEDDRVMVFVTWSGTHDGILRGYPATGKRVQVRSADVYRIQSGKIVEHWDVASPLDLMQQIGLLEFKFGKK